MKAFGKVLVALGVLAAGIFAVLKILERNRSGYTEVEFEDITEEAPEETQEPQE